MFDFLRKRKQRDVLARCEAELERTRKANAQFVNSPRDLTTRAALLEEARAVELGETQVVRQLDFLQRLLAGLADSIADNRVQSFISEAERLGLDDTDGVKRLRDHLRMLALAERGPEVIHREPDGLSVYLRCEVEHKNKPGTLVVRDDGIAFTGEVVIDIPWSRVVHVAKTTHSYQGVDTEAIAIQEGKRRTATKFAFWGRSSDYNCELIVRAADKFKGGNPN
jgi:hypothetical protein